MDSKLSIRSTKRSVLKLRKTLSPSDIGMKRTPSWNRLGFRSEPSYTNLTLPYRVVCRERYRERKRTIREQFLGEIDMLIDLQGGALAGAKLHREFCDPVLDRVKRGDLITLTSEQERKLEYLLRTDPKELL